MKRHALESLPTVGTVVNIPHVEVLELTIFNFLCSVLCSKPLLRADISIPEIPSMAYFLIPITTPRGTFPTPWGERPQSIGEMSVSSNINAPYFPTLSHLIRFSKCVMKTDKESVRKSEGITKMNNKYDNLRDRKK